MRPARLLLLSSVAPYKEARDACYGVACLPSPRARPVFEGAVKRLRAAPIPEGHVPARLLLPGLGRSMATQIRLERNLSALRVVEALRMYAAAHDGKLPDKLSDVTEGP